MKRFDLSGVLVVVAACIFGCGADPEAMAQDASADAASSAPDRVDAPDDRAVERDVGIDAPVAVVDSSVAEDAPDVPDDRAVERDVAIDARDAGVDALSARDAPDAPREAAVDVPPATVDTTVWLVGDSTVHNENSGILGWGDRIGTLMATRATVRNNGIGGTSSKSFYERSGSSNLWIASGASNSVLRNLHRGDYVLIQFGHNDENESDPVRYTTTGSAPTFRGTYRTWLERYLTDTRARGATPVLITSVSRMQWSGSTHRRTHGLYPDAMRRVAADNGVVLLDLERESHDVFQALGESATLRMYSTQMGTTSDRTHFSPDGALRLAEMVARLLRSSASPLASYVR